MNSIKRICAQVLYLRRFKALSKAIQMIAISRLQQLGWLIESRYYSLGAALELFSDKLVGNRQAVIIITSERSCCGRLNSDVLSVAKNALESYTLDNRYVSIISIGWKWSASLSIKNKSNIRYIAVVWTVYFGIMSVIISIRCL